MIGPIFKKLFLGMTFTYLAYLVFFWTLFKSWILLEFREIVLLFALILII